VKRRRFIGRVAQGALAAGAGWAGVLDRALAQAPARRTGTLQDVEHVVVLMQENRSFDHYFGWLNGVRGFADPFPLPGPGGRSVWLQPRDPGEPIRAGTAPHMAPFLLDTDKQAALMRAEGTPHRWIDAQHAWDHGRMANWPAAKRDHAMACFGPEALAFQVALADAFTLCDAYHCSFQGGTHPNRYFLNTGTIDPSGRGGGPALYNDFEDFGPAHGASSERGYGWTTYAERLQAAGVSWHVYQDLDDNFGDNSLAGFRRFRDAFHRRSTGDEVLVDRGASTGGLQRLRDDVVDGRLPAVSWIVGTAEGSEHPWKSSPVQGAAYVAQVLDALTANPDVWSRTVLFVNYDENDGYFDHVPPPAPPSVVRSGDGRFEYAGTSTVDTLGEYHLRLPPGVHGRDESEMLGRPYGLGPRVPMFVVSPWSRGGWVCSEVFDHTSVIRFMETRFGVREPNISAWRRAVCGDLTGTLDFVASPEGAPVRVVVPKTGPAAQRARAWPGTTRPQLPAIVVPPVQRHGPRPARALPYELHAGLIDAEDATIGVELHNPGRAAAVVHVIDRLRIGALPRRFTLESGTRLIDHWPLDNAGRHDLWLLGPNGWHRRFRGLTGRGAPRAWLGMPRREPSLRLQLWNTQDQPIEVTLHALAYLDGITRVERLAARSTRTLTLPLDPAHRWYDWRLTMAGDAVFLTRWAGHVETGQASVTDPAMHGPARLEDADEPAPRP